MPLWFPMVLKIHQCFPVEVTFLLWSLLVLSFHLHHQRQPLALQLGLQNHLFTHHRLLPKIIQLLQLVLAVFRACHPNFNGIHLSFAVLKFRFLVLRWGGSSVATTSASRSRVHPYLFFGVIFLFLLPWVRVVSLVVVE